MALYECFHKGCDEKLIIEQDLRQHLNTEHGVAYHSQDMEDLVKKAKKKAKGSEVNIDDVWREEKPANKKREKLTPSIKKKLIKQHLAKKNTTSCEYCGKETDGNRYCNQICNGSALRLKKEKRIEPGEGPIKERIIPVKRVLSYRKRLEETTEAKLKHNFVPEKKKKTNPQKKEDPIENKLVWKEKEKITVKKEIKVNLKDIAKVIGIKGDYEVHHTSDSLTFKLPEETK